MVQTVRRPEQASSFGLSKAELAFQNAEQLKSEDRLGAANSYRQTLALDPTHANAYINLTAMLCEDGDCDGALLLLQTAYRRGVRHALLSVTRALALEDLGNLRAALCSYEEALVLDPSLAEVHLNAARLMAALGNRRGAQRHRKASRRLQNGHGVAKLTR